ncbi:MAG TPA: hypothetical protein VFF31_16835 [Blastocatellia bacterium]|nr:hypothetical protein [Blastocatellia bacterium]
MAQYRVNGLLAAYFSKPARNIAKQYFRFGKAEASTRKSFD